MFGQKGDEGARGFPGPPGPIGLQVSATDVCFIAVKKYSNGIKAWFVVCVISVINREKLTRKPTFKSASCLKDVGRPSLTRDEKIITEIYCWYIKKKCPLAMSLSPGFIKVTIKKIFSVKLREMCVFRRVKNKQGKLNCDGS